MSEIDLSIAKLDKITAYDDTCLYDIDKDFERCVATIVLAISYILTGFNKYYKEDVKQNKEVSSALKTLLEHDNILDHFGVDKEQWEKLSNSYDKSDKYFNDDLILKDPLINFYTKMDKANIPIINQVHIVREIFVKCEYKYYALKKTDKDVERDIEIIKKYRRLLLN